MAEEPTGVGVYSLRAILVGTSVCFLFLFLAALVGTLLLFLGLDWSFYLSPVSLSMIYFGLAIGGIAGGAQTLARGWLVGLGTALLVVALSLTFCLLGGEKVAFGWLSLGRVAGACLVGLVGGALGVNFATNR